MFVITSVATLRERTSGTLERLLTMPLATLDLLLGYSGVSALELRDLAVVLGSAVLALALGAATLRRRTA